MKNSTDELITGIEVNDKQADFLEATMYGLDGTGVKIAGLVGGIGGGKTFTLALLMIISKEELPKGKGQFACLTVKQFKRSLFPGIKTVWHDLFGLREYNPKTGQGDFVLWKEPPKDWDRPYQEPEDWENCISFPNGWVCEVCGYKLDPDIHRGRNDDFAFMDEALKFKRDWLKILLGRIRANKGKFESNLHWLVSYFSSPPYGQAADWMFDAEDLMKEDPRHYFFIWITTKDNELFLPDNFISNLKKTLLPVEFKVEVLGVRLTKMPKTFYPSLDWEKHTAIDEEEFYDTDKELVASVDFNAHFTSATIWQDHGRAQHMIHQAFVYQPDDDMDMAQTLAKQLAEDLAGHGNKRITVTGDRNGANISAGTKKDNEGKYETFYDEMEEVLTAAGFDVTVAPLYFNPDKDEVYLLMQEVLAESNEEQICLRFHPIKGKSTLVSMQFTPITPDYKKDKRKEQKKDMDQRLAPHLSDTVDYYVIFKTRGGSVFGSFDLDFLD